MPRHNNTRRAARARKRGNRTRVNRWRTALDGGRWAFVDFQVTPPLGSSISKRYVNVCCLLRDEKSVTDSCPASEGRETSLPLKATLREGTAGQNDESTRFNFFLLKPSRVGKSFLIDALEMS